MWMLSSRYIIGRNDPIWGITDSGIKAIELSEAEYAGKWREPDFSMAYPPNKTEVDMKIVVAGTCLTGDCNCREKDGLDVKVAGVPPYHTEPFPCTCTCTCYVSAEQINAAELLPPDAKDVDDDAFVKGSQNLELPANKAIQADTKADGFESV